MAIYAISNNGTVVNRIVADAAFAAQIISGYDAVEEVTDQPVSIGDKYSNGIYVGPTSGPILVPVDSTLGLSITAYKNGGGLTYQWKKDGSNLTGETAATLSVASAQTSDSGEYTCVVSDGVTSLESDSCNVVVS